MLEEAIEKKKSGEEITEKEPEKHVNVNKTSYIPEHFTDNDYDKLDMYQKIDALASIDELNTYKEEIIDQYGRLPKEVNTLFQKKALDIRVNDPIVQGYREIKNSMEVTFSTLYSQHVDGVKLFESFTKISKDITIRYTGGMITATLPNSRDVLLLASEVIDKAKEAVKKDENR